MHLLLWLASFEKVRKDELMGFLKIVSPTYADQLESTLDSLVHSEQIEILSYQKLRLGRSVDYSVGTAVTDIANYGIPPHQLMAFLRNQGIFDFSALTHEMHEQVQADKLHNTKAGLLVLPSTGAHWSHA